MVGGGRSRTFTLDATWFIGAREQSIAVPTSGRESGGRPIRCRPQCWGVASEKLTLPACSWGCSKPAHPVGHPVVVVVGGGALVVRGLDQVGGACESAAEKAIVGQVTPPIRICRDPRETCEVSVQIARPVRIACRTIEGVEGGGICVSPFRWRLVLPEPVLLSLDPFTGRHVAAVIA